MQDPQHLEHTEREVNELLEAAATAHDKEVRQNRNINANHFNCNVFFPESPKPRCLE